MEIRKYKGWNIWSLENQWIQLYIAPQLGGRTLQMKMDKYEFLFVNLSLYGKESGITRLGDNGEWLNFGGEKIWPAPQGWDSPDQWPGPPDPVLDGGSYSAEVVISRKKEIIRLTSPCDDYTGLQITKEISLSEMRSEATVRAIFKNTGTVPRKWSVWPILQMNASGETPGQYQVVCPVNPKSRFENGYKVMHGLVNNPQYSIDTYGNMVTEYQYLVGKAGLDAVSSWLAFVDRLSGKVFVLMHQPEEGKVYPEDTSVQIWTQGRGMIFSRNTIREFKNDKILTPPYMEMELLSPLQEIQPGGEICFIYRMLVSSVPANESVARVNESGVIASPLKAESANGIISVNAKYGVFTNGAIKIILYYPSGNREPVCLYESQVSPSEGISVELSIKGKYQPEKGAFITAELYDRQGLFTGEIDKVILKEGFKI